MSEPRMPDGERETDPTQPYPSDHGPLPGGGPSPEPGSSPGQVTGTPPPGYGNPTQGGTPPGFDTPHPGYGTPPPAYGTPPPGYGPPPPGYDTPPPGYGTPPGYGYPPPVGPPHGFQPVGGPPPQQSRSLVPFIGGLLVGGVVIGAGLWYFLAGPGAPVETARPTPIAGVSPSAPPTRPSGSAPGPTLATPGTPTTGTPMPSDGGPSSQSPPTPTAGGPGPTIDAGVADQIRDVQAQVPPIRGLEALRDVPFRFISEDEFRVEFEADFREENPPERLASEQDVLRRMGFLATDADLEQLVLSLYQSQVAAFYDPQTGEFTIISRGDTEFGPLDRFFAAHEYDHALQDQHFDLEGTRITDPSEGDRAQAQLALIEGDATALMFEWASQHLELAELMDILSGSLSGADQELLDSMPPILQRQLEFPYLDGYTFVLRLHGQGGWPAVDEAFGDLPATTEQILHPEKYFAEEGPVPLEMPDVAASLGAGWTASSTQTLGEMAIGVWVADGAEAPAPLPGLPASLPNAEAAAGWGSDRLVSLDGPDGSWGVAWITAWDTEADALEFDEAATAALDDLPYAWYVRRTIIVDGVADPVLVLIADDDSTLGELERAVLEAL